MSNPIHNEPLWQYIYAMIERNDAELFNEDDPDQDNEKGRKKKRTLLATKLYKMIMGYRPDIYGQCRPDDRLFAIMSSTGLRDFYGFLTNGFKNYRFSRREELTALYLLMDIGDAIASGMAGCIKVMQIVERDIQNESAKKAE